MFWRPKVYMLNPFLPDIFASLCVPFSQDSIVTVESEVRTSREEREDMATRSSVLGSAYLLGTLSFGVHISVGPLLGNGLPLLSDACATKMPRHSGATQLQNRATIGCLSPESRRRHFANAVKRNSRSCDATIAGCVKFRQAWCCSPPEETFS